MAALQQKFGSEPTATNFGDADTVRSKINQWVSHRTHHKITQLDINLSVETFMVLVDAIFLKAKWETPFDAEDIRKRSFNNADGTTAKVDMTHICHSFAYERTDDYQNVILNYAGADLFMTIVLPKKGKDLYEIMRTDQWLEPEPSFDEDYEVDLRLPKFKFDKQLELKQVLTSLGLGDLFDTETSLLGGGGVDGAIHRAAGPGLLAECRLNNQGFRIDYFMASEEFMPRVIRSEILTDVADTTNNPILL